MSWTNNMPEFRNALRRVREATKKDEALIVNKALKDVAFRAMSFTPKADPGKIEADLMKDHLALKIAAKRLSKRVGASYVVKGKQQGLLRVTRRQIGAEARRIINKRKSKRGFMRAGWIPAIKALGGVLSGEKAKSPLASLGFAKLATPGNPSGEIANMVFDRMSGKAASRSRAQMEVALEKAVAYVTADREVYAQQQIEKTLRAHSD